MSKLWKCVSKVAKGILAVVDAVGVVLDVVFAGGGLHSVARYGRRKVDGIGNWIDAKIKKIDDEMDEFDRITSNAGVIVAEFRRMKQDSGKMDVFFDDFVTALKAPMSAMDVIGGQMDKEKAANFILIKCNVKKIGFVQADFKN